MNEAQWEFTLIQWEHYIGQTTVSEATKLTQLQAVYIDDLRQHFLIPYSITSLTLMNFS